MGGVTTGTNDSCATAENLGTVTLSSSSVVTGSLSSIVGTSYDLTQDQDFYTFTVGEDGSYEIDLDCFSTGADANGLDLVILDSSCGYLGETGPSQPYASMGSPPLTAGTQIIVVVIGMSGTTPLPYRLSIVPMP
jgi:hypothetical protein